MLGYGGCAFCGDSCGVGASYLSLVVVGWWELMVSIGGVV